MNTPFPLDACVAALSPDLDDTLLKQVRAALDTLRKSDNPAGAIVTVAILLEGEHGLLGRISAAHGYKLKGFNLDAQVEELAQKGVVYRDIASNLHWIRIRANLARHNDNKAPLKPRHAEITLEHLLEILEWYYCEYEHGPRWATLYTNERRRNVQVRRSLGRWLRSHCWVGYDPSRFDPLLCPDPSLDSIRQDLSWIRAAGLSGVVTFCSRGTLADIPSLAKLQGLDVIMGVWDASDPTEVARAAEQAGSVDAFCVGHNGLRDDRYLLEDLEASVRQLRERTGKPVSTSEEVRLYRDNPDLATLGDWLFPDVHLSLRTLSADRAGPQVDRRLEHFLALAREVATLAQLHKRPLVLKLLVYPWKGVEEASPEFQRCFFAEVLDRLGSPETGLKVPVTLVTHSAFDAPWKLGGPFHPWDPYTGLLETDGTARPAVGEIVRRRWYAT